ncbi:MAG: hypothetical protein AAB250_08115 [Bdellovibrionota bacterium]
MGDVIFVIKTLVITVALVVMMQIKIGPNTIEQHSLAWIHHSAAVEELQEVAAGAVKAGRKGVTYVKGLIGMKQSEAYYRQLERNAQEARDLAVEKIGAAAVSTSEAITEATE